MSTTLSITVYTDVTFATVSEKLAVIVSDLTQTLAAFRASNSQIFSGKVFLTTNQFSVPESSEGSFSIGGIVSENAFSMMVKSSLANTLLNQGGSVSVTAADNSAIKSPLAPTQTGSLTNSKATMDFGTKEDTVANMSLPVYQYDDTKRDALLKTLTNLRLRQIVDESYKPYFGVVDWDDKDVLINRPEVFLRSKTFYTLSESEAVANNSSVTSFDNGISTPWFGTDVNFKKQKSHMSSDRKSMLYLHSFYSVPRVEYEVPLDKISLTPTFIDQLKQVKTYTDLKSLLRKTGECVPTRFILGGKILFSDKREITNQENKNEILKSFGASVKLQLQGNLTSVGSISAGGGNAQVSDTSTNLRNENDTTTMTVIGGDPCQRKTVNQWIASLASEASWSIIYRERVSTIWDILKKTNLDLYNTLKQLKDQHKSKNVDPSSKFESILEIEAKSYSPSGEYELNNFSYLRVNDKILKTSERGVNIFIIDHKRFVKYYHFDTHVKDEVTKHHLKSMNASDLVNHQIKELRDDKYKNCWFVILSHEESAKYLTGDCLNFMENHVSVTEGGSFVIIGQTTPYEVVKADYNFRGNNTVLRYVVPIPTTSSAPATPVPTTQISPDVSADKPKQQTPTKSAS